MAIKKYSYYLGFYMNHSVNAVYLHYAYPQCTVRVICGDKGVSTGKDWVRPLAGPEA